MQQSTRNMNYQTAMQSFKIMMGAPLEEKVVIVDSDSKTGDWSEFATVGGSLGNKRADYQIAVQDLNLAKQQTKIIQSKYLPQFAIGVRNLG